MSLIEMSVVATSSHHGATNVLDRSHVRMLQKSVFVAGNSRQPGVLHVPKRFESIWSEKPPPPPPPLPPYGIMLMVTSDAVWVFSGRELSTSAVDAKGVRAMARLDKRKAARSRMRESIR
jgi:hypothetical protein